MQKNRISKIIDKCIVDNKKFIRYCFICQYHLCEDCLKSKKHINHYKNSIFELEPCEEELNIIKKRIDDYN